MDTGRRAELLVKLLRWSDDVALQDIPRRFWKAPAGQGDSGAGPNAEIGDVQEANPPEETLQGAEGGERWELEADPRHVEILISQMGLGDESKAVSTPHLVSSSLSHNVQVCHSSCTF